MPELMEMQFSRAWEKMVEMNLIFYCIFRYLILSLRLAISEYCYNTKLTIVGSVIYYIYFQIIGHASSKLKETPNSSFKCFFYPNYDRFVFSLHSRRLIAPLLQQTAVQRSPILMFFIQLSSVSQAVCLSAVRRTRMCLKNLLRLEKSIKFQVRISPCSFLKSTVTSFFINQIIIYRNYHILAYQQAQTLEQTRLSLPFILQKRKSFFAFQKLKDQSYENRFKIVITYTDQTQLFLFVTVFVTKFSVISVYSVQSRNAYSKILQKSYSLQTQSQLSYSSDSLYIRTHFLSQCSLFLALLFFTFFVSLVKQVSRQYVSVSNAQEYIMDYQHNGFISGCILLQQQLVCYLLMMRD